MNILVLFGSPRKKGNTARLLNIFLDLFQNNENQKKQIGIEIVDAYEVNARPCLGCLRCKSKNACVHDDLNDIMNSILSCDLLIIASPVYQYSFPAPLKAIIDRLERFYEPENLFQELPNKAGIGKGVLLVTAGSSGKYSFDILEKQAKMAFMITKKKYMGSLMFPNMDAKDFTPETFRKAKELYEKILEN